LWKQLPPHSAKSGSGGPTQHLPVSGRLQSINRGWGRRYATFFRAVARSPLSRGVKYQGEPMSWWTFSDFMYLDTQEFDVERIRPDIESMVTAGRYHLDVAKDICNLLAKKQTNFKLNSFAVIQLLSELARQFPAISFSIRGRGEEMRDIWVREFSDGKETFAFGPPEGVGY
jgi:hypothetical protein